MDGENKTIYRSSDDTTTAAPQAPIAPESKKGGKKEKKEKGSKKARVRSALIITLLFILALGAVAAALYFTGILTGIINKLTPVEYYEYSVSDKETLLRYLGHSALKAGDTLYVNDFITVDVEEDLGGFAELPLVNWQGNGTATFSGGTVLMLGGGANKADLSALSVSSCSLYIDAPKTSITWADATGEDKINCASLNGRSNLNDLAIKAVGSVFEVEVVVTNNRSQSVQNAEIKLSSPNYAFVDGSSFTVESIEPGKSAVAKIKVIATEAGRAKVTATCVDAAGNILLSGGSDYQTISGAGYYSGDPHTHSTVSEHGNTSSISENIVAAWKQGMSFIGSVEKHQTAQKYSQNDVDYLTGELGSFLQITGVENGSGKGDRHLMAYGTDVIPSSTYRVDPYNGKTWVMQDAVDAMVADGGIVILPHFFYSYDILESISLARSLRDITALEILHGGIEIGSMEYIVGMNVWNNLNVRGRQRAFILAGSNYGSSEYIGTRYTKGFMTALTENAYLEMLRSGNYFVTNGPEMSFKLGSGVMGGEVTAAEGETLLCRISASDDTPLKSITVYKYVVTGVIDNEIKEEVLSLDFTGKGICSYSDVFEITADGTNSYYRMEVVSECANIGTDNGLAFSNPIWVTNGEKSGDGLFKGIEAVPGATLTLTDNGSYLLSARYPSEDSIIVNADENANVTVTYHKVESDNFCDYITVRIISPAGSIHTETIYVA